MASKPPLGRDSDNEFTFAENDGDDIRFHNSCLEEIDRYRRADEWLPSFHNVLSKTALNSTRILTVAGVIHTTPSHLIQYTRDGTADDLRLNAFSNLFEMGMGKNDAVLRWFLYAMGTDPSPYFRDHAFHLLGKFLGTLAIGQTSEAETTQQQQQQDSLIIEQEASTETRKADLARRTTVTGALAALRDEIKDNETLKRGLWTAITSPTLSIREMKPLLDLCAYLFKEESQMIVRLRYPRYWQCRKTGKATLLFSHTDRIRTKPLPKRLPPLPPPPLQLPLTSPTERAEMSSAGTPLSSSAAMAPPPAQRKLLFKPPKKPSVPSLPSEGSEASLGTASQASSTVTVTEGEKPKLKIKLKVGNAGARLGEGR
ncbi:MAG: hypothetical protein L6R40_008539 [Gallowayella cf. fulva]|nr:MAG: hypothetical protein L6R40_008539 [Xanthomendoza cf. fulva]